MTGIAYLTARGEWKRKVVRNQEALEKWYDANGGKYERVETRPVH